VADGVAPLDGDGNVYGASPTELGYLVGVTSTIQAQIDAMLAQIDALDAELDAGVAAAWIKFNMATDAIAASFNVSSITDKATGSDTIVWDTDFASADYATTTGWELVASNSVVHLSTMAAGSLIVQAYASSAPNDHPLVCVTAFGAQV
jgi:hypothetical protein